MVIIIIVIIIIINSLTSLGFTVIYEEIQPARSSRYFGISIERFPPLDLRTK